MELSKTDIVGLAILADLEKFRTEKLEAGETNVDWVVRICEAIVAEYTQFKSRAGWVQAIKEDW